MIILDCPQNTPEWMLARSGIPTASAFDKIITSTGKPSSQSETYMHGLIAEWLAGKSYETEYKSIWMERGHEVEDEARAYYEMTTGHSVTQPGLIYKDESKLVSCSPDGLIEESHGLEIKCPKHSTHIGYLLKPALPNQYKIQVQGSMWITGLARWDFMSYHPDFDPVLIEVQRDDIFIKKIELAVNNFIKQMLRLRNKLAPDTKQPATKAKKSKLQIEI